MKTRTKAFDCVELQHRGGAMIRRKLRGMTREQESEYWRRRSEQFLKEWETARQRPRPVRPPLPPVKAKKKAFDCVEFQHRAGAHIRRKLRGMTPAQEVAFWQQQSDELEQRQRELRAKSTRSRRS